MDDKEHFIYLLQSCYFGDRTAFNELAMIYKQQREIIEKVREYIKNIPDDEFVESEHFTELLEILDKEKK